VRSATLQGEIDTLSPATVPLPPEPSQRAGPMGPQRGYCLVQKQGEHHINGVLVWNGLIRRGAQNNMPRSLLRRNRKMLHCINVL
jgi:hypothetical protein